MTTLRCMAVVEFVGTDTRPTTCGFFVLDVTLSCPIFSIRPKAIGVDKAHP